MVPEFGLPWFWFVLVFGCGGSTPAPTLVSRAATPDECVNGGTTLIVDGQVSATVCNGGTGATGTSGPAGKNGVDGRDGIQGAPGATGKTGVAGTPGQGGEAEVSALVSCIAAQHSSLLAIQCTDGTTIETGSGTVTLSGQILTAAHVGAIMTPTFPCSVFDIDSDHTTTLGTVTATTPYPNAYDMTVLDVAWTGTPPAGITAVTASPLLGDLVVATGHPDALRSLQYAAGFVTAVGVEEMGAEWAGAFMADYSANGGSSGGAIFDSKCQWVGIHVGGFSDGYESSVALPF